MNLPKKEEKKVMGDHRAVAKQQIHKESVTAEMRFHHLNRTKDF